MARKAKHHRSGPGLWLVFGAGLLIGGLVMAAAQRAVARSGDAAAPRRLQIIVVDDAESLAANPAGAGLAPRPGEQAALH